MGAPGTQERNTIMKACVNKAILMAIAGIISGVTTYHITVRRETLPCDYSGMYEWQWAGENWYGRVELSDHKTISRARVGLIKKEYLSTGKSRFVMGEEIMKLVDGTYSVKPNGNVMIDMRVRKKVAGSVADDVEQTIQGTLEMRSCLAGRVRYQDPITGQHHEGDMILVDYLSHLGDEVATWCAETE